MSAVASNASQIPVRSIGVELKPNFRRSLYLPWNLGSGECESL